MFVRYYVDIDLPLARCREALLSDPETWLPDIVWDAQAPGAGILAKVGFSMFTLDFRKRVELRIGEPVALRDWLHLPIHWHADPAHDLFPTFDGEIQLVPIDPGVTKLAVAGTYDAPMGDVGRTIDQMVLHTAAEATIRDFVNRVARHLEGGRAKALAV